MRGKKRVSYSFGLIFSFELDRRIHSSEEHCSAVAREISCNTFSFIFQLIIQFPLHFNSGSEQQQQPSLIPLSGVGYMDQITPYVLS